ncbi:MAG: PEP-CTERM sorting domain-containing protein [Planctomycetota bacterium]
MKKTSLTLVALIGLFLIPATAKADIVWKFTDDGNGNIRETISGTLDLSAGTDYLHTGVGGGFDLFKTDAYDLVQVHRYTTATTGRSWGVVMDGYATNPDIQLVNTSISTNSGWQNTDHLLFQIFNNSNIFRAFDFDGKFSSGPTAITEDVVHNVPLSTINEGVWRYGNLDDNIEGNCLLFVVGNASIPEPTSFVMVSLCVLGAAGRRRLRGEVLCHKAEDEC